MRAGHRGHASSVCRHSVAGTGTGDIRAINIRFHNDFRIGQGVAWNKEDPTTGRDDIIDIARSLARSGR
jgi:hypothetical protein